MQLLVVIVNYRTAALTIDCLRSLEPQIRRMRDAHVVVTDNQSPDDSVPQIGDAIRTHGWEEWLTLLPLPRNGGFAYGNNEGIRPALSSNRPPRYVLLLNPDTVVRPGALQPMIDFLDSHPRVGIVGSRLEHPNGDAQRSAFRFPSVLSEFEGGVRVGLVSRLLRKRVVAPPVPTRACQVDWVAGASMMIRREVFDAIGLMDERFFMYYEEVDFCLRARQAGWPCWYVPQSRVVHLVGQSSGVTDVKKSTRRRPGYWFDSRKHYFLSHFGPIGKIFADSAWVLGFALHRLRRMVLRKQDNDPANLLWDFIRYNFFLAGR